MDLKNQNQYKHKPENQIKKQINRLAAILNGNIETSDKNDM